VEKLLHGFLPLAIVALVAFMTAASVTQADHFKKLSPNHTGYGVAQLNYGNIARSELSATRPAVKIMNPNHVTQVVAIFVYEAARGANAGTTGAYVDCRVRQVTPHGSLGIPEIEFPDSGTAMYAEAIWAPVHEVTVFEDDDEHGGRDDDDEAFATRFADGLGGSFATTVFGAEGLSNLAHPELFSLPNDDASPGQRQAAIDCVLLGLASLGLDPNIFTQFGIEPGR
jgi:hypothetical protein